MNERPSSSYILRCTFANPFFQQIVRKRKKIKKMKKKLLASLFACLLELTFRLLVLGRLTSSED